MPRWLTATVFASLSLGWLACSGEEERPRAKPAAAAAEQVQRWAFVDAFRALKSSDPDQRLQGVTWIGAHLVTHAVLAKEALRAAASDDDSEVAARAKALLRQLGER